MPRDYLTYAPEYFPNGAVDKLRAQEQINEKILDNTEPRANTEVPDPHEHRFNAIDVVCLFGGGAQSRVISRSNFSASL